MKLVEVLFFDGCPNVELAVDRAREAIARAGAPADLRLVRIAGEDQAVQCGFLGSPSVRVDGVDVDASARERSDFGSQCRVYSLSGRLEGAPPTQWIEALLLGEAPRPSAPPPAPVTGCCSPGRKN